MGAIDTTQANKIINASLAGTAAQAATSIKMKLGTSATVPTGTTDMTELSGTGYTAGGTVTAWNSASGGSATNSGTPSWTNGSGSSWTISYLELWETGGSALRWWYGAWTGQPITVANGNTFAVAAAAVSAGLS